MRVVSMSAVLGVVAVAALLTFETTGSAQGPNKCLAGKNKCVSKKVQGLLKCHSKAEKTGLSLDTTCTQKVMDKYDGGAVPANGCFAKLETKNDGPCVTNTDSTPLENKVDAFVTDVVQELDPGFPAPVQNICSAGKKNCVRKKVAGILKCHQKAVAAGTPATVDPTCIQKVRDKFDGGADPSKGCFAKLEANHQPCLTGSDVTTIENKVDAFVMDVLCELGYTTQLNPCPPPATPTPTATQTPVPTPTATCGPGFAYNGALVPTAGRFNYNLMIGLPAANNACSTNFSGAHACSYVELLCAQTAGSLVGAMDTSSMAVGSYWAIDSTAPVLTQCNDDAMGGSGLNWEYATAHTGSRGRKVTLNGGTGTLGPLSSGLQCNALGGGTPSNVGCCH